MLILLNNRAAKILGALIKAFCYLFYWVMPKKRFIIPSYSSPKAKQKVETKIPKTIWQTNFTNRVTLPIYINYLYNRLMSLDWEYNYVSTEERLAYIRQHGTEREIAAYERLTNGASQADFWRLFVLNREGGVYMDIDAHAVWPLSRIIKPHEEQIILSRPKDYTNYFIASAPNNSLLQKVINRIVENIESDNKDNKNVYGLTGTGVLNEIIGEEEVNHISYKITCIQGSFTNEYFQYMDRPRTKWTYAKNEDLLK